MNVINALEEKGLTRRQAEVAEKVALGLSNKEAATALFICEKTVKFHLTTVYRLLRVENRSKLIVMVSEMVSPPPLAALPTGHESAL